MTKKSRTHNNKALLLLTLMQFMFIGHSVASENILTSVFNWIDSGAAKMSDVAVKYSEIKESMNVNGLDFSPDGKYLATSSYASSDEVHVWEWESKRLVQKLYKQPGAGGNSLMKEGLRYSPDGRFLAACHGRAGKEHIVSRIWDTRTGGIVHNVIEPNTGYCSAIAFSPDSQLLFLVNGFALTGNSIIAYSTKTWQIEWGLGTDPFSPVTISVSPDGKLAAFGGTVAKSNQPQILIVDLMTHTVVRTINTFPINNQINQVAWSSDGTHIAAGAVVDGTFAGPDIVKIFDVGKGKQISAEATEPPADIRTLRYSPDGKYLAEGSVNHKIRIWDSQHKTLLQEIPVKDYGMSLTFSRDGHFMAVTMGGTEIQIWKMK